MAVLVLHWLLLKREEKNSKSCLMRANSEIRIEIIRLHELVKMLYQLEKICIGVYSYVFVCSYHYLNLNKSRFTSLVLPFLIVLFANLEKVIFLVAVVAVRIWTTFSKKHVENY